MKINNIILLMVCLILFVLAFKFLNRTIFYIVGTLLLFGFAAIFAIMNIQEK